MIRGGRVTERRGVDTSGPSREPGRPRSGHGKAQVGTYPDLRPGGYVVWFGGLLTLAGIANNLMLPPPVWFWVLTVIVFLPATYLGARLALRRGTTVAVPQNDGLQLPAGASPACDQGRHCRAPAPA